jgi:hypothetical protein
MKQQRFDRNLEILGFAKGSELASALGLTRKSSSHCRQNGVPGESARRPDALARERGRGQDHRARAGLVGPTVRGVRRDDRSAHCPPPADVRSRRNPRWDVPGLADAARHGATMTDQLFEDAPGRGQLEAPPAIRRAGDQAPAPGLSQRHRHQADVGGQGRRGDHSHGGERRDAARSD